MRAGHVVEVSPTHNDSAPRLESLTLRNFRVYPNSMQIRKKMSLWYSSKLTRLNEINDDDTKREVLSEMTIKLRSLTNPELEELARGIDLTGLFAHLTSNDRLIIEETCNNLRIIFNILEPGEAHRRYPTEIVKFLEHSEPAVKILILSEAKRMATSDEQSPPLSNNTNLLVPIIEAIGDADLGVANLAMDVTKIVGAKPEAARILYSGSLLRTIARLLAKNDIVSFRVYEVVVDIAKSSAECLEASAASGFLSSLINILEHEDILLQLNALQVLTELATSEDGLEYLERRDVLRKLSDKIARAREDPLSNLLVPGLMKFFGGVARSRPNDVFSKYPAVVSALFEVIDARDLALLGNALDTLGYVASSTDGKYALELLGGSMPSALRTIGEIVQKMPSEYRVRGLENLALMLRVEKTEQDNRITSLTKSWFDRLGDDPLGLLVSLCKQPFPDIRLSSLEVLETISSQSWGQEYIANCPGLVEFLLDRSAEAFKNCKEAKYRIVKNLCVAGNEVLDSGTLESLKGFIREGPFHVDAGMEVVTEGAD